MMPRQFYVSLSSNACKEFYPSNNAGDFMIKLPSTLNFDTPGWVCGLCEIQFTPLPNAPEAMFLLMNICQESIVNSQTLPLLRTLYTSNYKITRKPLSISFDRVFYIPVKQQQVDQIHLYIKAVDNDLLSFTDKPLRCTLHFKRLASG